MLGGWVSLTTMWKLQLAVLLALSVAVQLQLTETPGQLSEAETE
jgi:hypothetical protein